MGAATAGGAGAAKGNDAPVQQKEAEMTKVDALNHQTSPRLSVLDTFLAVARHRSFVGAASDADLDPSSVERQIEALQDWLGRILLLNDVPLEITADGQEFRSIAHAVLLAVDTLAAHLSDRGELTRLDPRHLRLGDFQAVAAVARTRNYQRAEGEIKRPYQSVRRGVKRIEDTFQQQLVEGYSELRLLAAGEHIVEVARQVDALIGGFRTPMITATEHTLLVVRRWQKMVRNRRIAIRSYIRCIKGMKRLTPRWRIALAQAEKEASMLDQAHQEFERVLGPVPGASAKDIDVSQLSKGIQQGLD